MPAPAPFTETAVAGPAVPPDDVWAERQLAALGRLVEAGLEIAQALETQVKGGEVVVQGDVAMAYGRVARAVRQTIMLQSSLIEARRDRTAARTARQAAARSSAARLLRDVIDGEPGGDRERAEGLAREAAERLRREDFGGLLSRPFSEAVADICRDLGLEPDWLRLAEDAAAAERALDAPAAPDSADAGPMVLQWLGPEPALRPDSS